MPRGDGPSPLSWRLRGPGTPERVEKVPSMWPRLGGLDAEILEKIDAIYIGGGVMEEEIKQMFFDEEMPPSLSEIYDSLRRLVKQGLLEVALDEALGESVWVLTELGSSVASDLRSAR